MIMFGYVKGWLINIVDDARLAIQVPDSYSELTINH